MSLDHAFTPLYHYDTFVSSRLKRSTSTISLSILQRFLFMGWWPKWQSYLLFFFSIFLSLLLSTMCLTITGEFNIPLAVWHAHVGFTIDCLLPMFSKTFVYVQSGPYSNARIPIESTHWHILLKTYCSGPGDSGGLGDGGGRGCSGHQGASLARLRGFRRLGLGLCLSQSQTAWCSNRALHLHRRVTWLLAILDVLYTWWTRRKELTSTFTLNDTTLI